MRPGRLAIRYSLFVIPGLLIVATLLDQRVHALFDAGTLPAVPKPGYYLLNASGVAGLWLLVALVYLAVDGLRVRFRSAERTLVRAAAIIAPVLIAGVAGEALKIAIRRERPLGHGEYVFRAWGQGWDSTSGLGLPSTHAAVAFAAAAALSRLHRRGRYAWYALAIGCVYTRLQPDDAGEAAHFLSDVVAGAALGWLAERLVNRELVGGRLYADAESQRAAPQPAIGGEGASSESQRVGGDMGPCHLARGEPLGWMTWPTTVALTLAVLIIRVLYLRLACGYELTGAEALYWDWSRAPDAFDFDRGADLTHLIAFATAAFGVSEWAVRMPMAICSAIATLGVAGLATRAGGGDQRAGFIAAAMFSLTPVYQATAQTATPDALALTCVVLGCWTLFAVTRGFASVSAARVGTLLSLGVLVGLVLVGRTSTIAAATFASASPWTWLLALNPPLLVLAAAALLGAMSATGCRRNLREGWLLGPAGVALVAGTGVALWTGRGWLWLQLAFLPFIVLAAVYVVPRLVEHRRALAAWRGLPQRPRPWLGRLRRRPETPVTAFWDWTIIYGVAGWLFLSFTNVLATTALVGPHVDAARLGGSRARASVSGACAEALTLRAARRPHFLAVDPETAALTAFYLPGRPFVPSARHVSTDGGDAAWIGGDVLLIGGNGDEWTPLVDVEAFETLDAEHGVHVGWGYRGLRPRAGG